MVRDFISPVPTVILAPAHSMLPVVPAHAGTHCIMPTVDPGVRRDDSGAASR